MRGSLHRSDSEWMRARRAGNAPGLLQKRLAPSPNIVGARPSVTFLTRRLRPDSARAAG
jgi:hypothetical protein